MALSPPHLLTRPVQKLCACSSSSSTGPHKADDVGRAAQGRGCGEDRTRQRMWGGPHKAEDVGRTAQGRGSGEGRTRQRMWGGPLKAEDVGRGC